MGRNVLSIERERKLRRNPRWLFWTSAFRELQAINSFIAIFQLARGVTESELFLLSIAFSIVTLALEIPSGFLADWLGRKPTMMIGGVCFLSSVGVLFFASGFWWFAASVALLSSGYAMVSGAEDALMYDTLVELGEEDKTNHHSARLHVSRHVLKIFVPMFAAFMATELTEPQFMLVIACDVIIKLASFGYLLRLTEPLVRQKIGPEIARQAWDTLKQYPHLKRLSNNRWFVFASGFVLWRVYQPFLQEVELGVLGLGIFYFLMHLLGALSKWHIDFFSRVFGVRAVLVYFPLIGFALLVPAAFAQTLFWRFGLILVAMTLIFMRQPLFMRMFNHHIKPASRATVQSALNMRKPFIDIPLVSLSALIVYFLNWQAVLFFAAAIGMLSVLIIQIHKSDYTFDDKPS